MSNSSKNQLAANVEVNQGEILVELKGEVQNIQSSYWLNSQNHLQWSQVVKIFLKENRKLSHLMGIGPATKNAMFTKGNGEDSMIISWLWNSMTPEVSWTCMILITTKEICQTYLKIQDDVLIYEIRTKISSTK